MTCNLSLVTDVLGNFVRHMTDGEGQVLCAPQSSLSFVSQEGPKLNNLTVSNKICIKIYNVLACVVVGSTML